MEETTMKVVLLRKGNPNETIFVLGGTGKGKTTLIANLLRERSRFVIFDAKNDYNETYFGKGTRTVADVKAFAIQLNEGTEKIIFKLHSLDADSDLQLDSALEYLCLFQRNNLHLEPVAVSLDELNRFCESGSDCPQYLQEIIQRGRDYKIVKIFGAQWFNKIPPFMRDSFSEIYTFRHSEKIALSRLEDYGFPNDDVKNLPDHVCLHTGKNGIEKIRLVPTRSDFSEPKQEQNTNQETVETTL